MKNSKRIAALGLAAMMVAGLAGCGASSSQAGTDTTAQTQAEVVTDEKAGTETGTTESAEDGTEQTEVTTTETFDETEIQVFAAASLSAVLEDLIADYNAKQPNVTITVNADSSGTLLTQIQEGYECDVFFSAAQKQMNTLEEAGSLVDGTRANVVNNQVCVVTYPGSNTKVTGLANLSEATSIALADGSVPVGKYTRQAMIKANMLTVSEGTEAADVTTQQVSEALGGVEINECGNVSKVRTAITEQSNEVGTVYYSDTYGFEDQLEIIEKVGYDLTGDVIYPIAQVQNAEADELQTAAAKDFVTFITSDEAKAVFDKYLFDTNVK